LSIACRDDYARGGFPMLPVHIPPRAAAWWVLLHTSGTALGALALAVHPRPAWLYAVPVGLATAGLLVLSGRLVAKPSKTRALVLFHASNLYLAIVMLMVCLNAIVS
jgi:protoheme IX farnesyltransferase